MAKRQSGEYSVLSPEDVVIEDIDFRNGKDRRIAYDPQGNPIVDVQLRYEEGDIDSVNGYARIDGGVDLVPYSNLERDYRSDLGGGFDIVDYAFDVIETGERNIFVFNELGSGDSSINFQEQNPDLTELSQSVASHMESRYPVRFTGDSGENLDAWERMTWENIIHRTLKGD